MWDDNPLNEEEKALVEKNLPLVKWEVKRQRPRDSCERDEWIQEGVFGLIRAIKTHTKNKGLLSKWMLLNIRYKIFIFRSRDGVINLPKIIHDSNKSHAERAKSIRGSSILNENYIIDGNPAIDDRIIELNDSIEEALKKLRGEDREILDLCFNQCLTQKEAADQLGLSFQRVGQRVRKALSNLRVSYSKLDSGEHYRDY